MKIQILSDMHNELWEYHSETATQSRETREAALAERRDIEQAMGLNPDLSRAALIEPTDADAIILAGDIDKARQAAYWAIREARALYKPILWVPGNHEFYGSELKKALTEMRTIVGTETSQVYLLDQDAWIYQGVRFLGTTLWTDYQALPEVKQAAAMYEAEWGMRDHQAIKWRNRSGYRRFKPSDALQLHMKAKEWLTQKLSEPFDGKTVVITHHGPSAVCQHPAYPLSAVSAAFHSNLEHLMGEDRVALWVYGHTHACLDTEIKGTRLVSNQKGYPGETVPGFDPAFVVEI